MTEVVNYSKMSYEEDYEYIGRSGENGSNHMNNTRVGKKGWLGNPYTLDEFPREVSVEKFAEDFEERLEKDDVFREEVENLEGKKLACFCKPRLCHGDVIKHYIETGEVVENVEQLGSGDDIDG